MTAAERIALDDRAVAEHLVARGLAGDVGAVVELSGGVSGKVFWAETDRGPVVVKQPLDRLAVAADWCVSPDRALTEAAAILAARAVLDDRVPALVDLDADQRILVLAVAATGATTWKTQLMAGDGNLETATAAARLLGELHRRTTDLKDARLASRAHFLELRIRPYFRASAEAMPHLRTLLRSAEATALSRPRCLVHGDFSPKNVLVDPVRPGAVAAVDWEVAHLGVPEFDLAFLLSHLLLKRLSGRVNGGELGLQVIRTYRDGSGFAADDSATGRLLGALLIARVAGWSPVEYLDPSGADSAVGLGVQLLRGELLPIEALETARCP